MFNPEIVAFLEKQSDFDLISLAKYADDESEVVKAARARS